MKRFYVAHVRGPDYRQLKKRGFLVLYPDVDDYVFLEATTENQKLLKKQLELGVAFLKRKGQFVTVSEDEVRRMTKETTESNLGVGTEIEIISGYCENMDGTVLEVAGSEIRALLRGYRRVYDVTVNRLDVIAKQKEPQTT